jgi:hypothetical protein
MHVAPPLIPWRGGDVLRWWPAIRVVPEASDVWGVGFRALPRCCALALWLLGGLSLGTGCATRGERRPPRPLAPKADQASPPAPLLTLAWLPLEAFAQRELAEALERELAAAPVAGVGRRARAPVSMEVAQLSLECIDDEPRCYQVVGQQLGADRLLWAELVARRRGPGPLRATVILFDVEGAVEVGRAEREFDGREAAAAGFAALVAQAVAGPARDGVARATAVPR